MTGPARSDVHAVEGWSAPLTAEEREALLSAAVQAVARRGLQIPALFALEVHRPFGFLAAHGLALAGPLFGPLLGIERIHTLARLLQEPGVIDDLIRRLEESAAEERKKD